MAKLTNLHAPAPAPPLPPQGLTREVFEDLVYVAVLGQCKLHDVAAGAALVAWDKWQAARSQARK